MNRDLKKAYNKKIGKYRFKKINRHTGIFEDEYFDLSMSSVVMQMKSEKMLITHFKVYPYKYYWLRCVGWFLCSIFSFPPKKPLSSNIIYRLAKNPIIQIISIIVILYSFIKILESIFRINSVYVDELREFGSYSGWIRRDSIDKKTATINPVEKPPRKIKRADLVIN